MTTSPTRQACDQRVGFAKCDQGIPYLTANARYCLTLGSYPGSTFLSAMARGHTSGRSVGHVQICPQNFGCLDATVDELMNHYPATRFRLHANVRLNGHARSFDAGTEGPDADRYFRDMATISQRLGASVYTLHAGDHRGRPLSKLADRARWLEDQFGHRVGIEGLYPTAGKPWWLSSWDDYCWLLDAGIDYCIDLSHLNIVATRSRRLETSLARELIGSPRCCEIHVSANDGYADLHARVSRTPTVWWSTLLSASNPDAVIFDESNEVREESVEDLVMKEAQARQIGRTGFDEKSGLHARPSIET